MRLELGKMHQARGSFIIRHLTTKHFALKRPLSIS